LLGRKKLGGTRQFGPEGFGLTLEAVGVVLPALNESSLAALLEFHYLELETDCVVFQTRVHHHYATYPRLLVGKRQSAKPAARLLRRVAFASSSADSRALWTASSRVWRVEPIRSPASALAVAMAPLAFVQ
jgi:hypothetical protein